MFKKQKAVRFGQPLQFGVILFQPSGSKHYRCEIPDGRTG
jgi:hypothetical protein